MYRIKIFIFALFIFFICFFSSEESFCQCKLSKEKWVYFRPCVADCVPDIKIMTPSNMLFESRNSSGSTAFAKKGNEYYFRYASVVGFTTKEYTVTAGEEPLIIFLENGDKVDVYTTCNIVSVRTLGKMQFCGFYSITKEQIQQLSSSKIDKIHHYIGSDEVVRSGELEQDDNGNKYFVYKPKAGKRQASCMEPAKCILSQ